MTRLETSPWRRDEADWDLWGVFVTLSWTLPLSRPGVGNRRKAQAYHVFSGLTSSGPVSKSHCVLEGGNASPLDDPSTRHKDLASLRWMDRWWVVGF